MNTTELNAIERAARATSINQRQIDRLLDQCDKLQSERDALLAALSRALHYKNTHWMNTDALDFCVMTYRSIDPHGVIERSATPASRGTAMRRSAPLPGRDIPPSSHWCNRPASEVPE